MVMNRENRESEEGLREAEKTSVEKPKRSLEY